MSKKEQLTAVSELLWIAKRCMSRIVCTAWDALDKQTKNAHARAEGSLVELMRLVDNAKDMCKEGGAE